MPHPTTTFTDILHMIVCLLFFCCTETLNQTLNLVGPARNIFDNIQSVAHYKGNIARAGLNYKFW
jgi:hypothetical protein